MLVPWATAHELPQNCIPPSKKINFTFLMVSQTHLCALSPLLLLHEVPDTPACGVKRPSSDPTSVYMFCSLRVMGLALNQDMDGELTASLLAGWDLLKVRGPSIPPSLKQLSRDLGVILNTSSICFLPFLSRSAYFPLPVPVWWGLHCSQLT